MLRPKHAKQASHAWCTLLKKYLIKSERACSVHWRACNVHQTCSKRIQRACNARGTYSKRIRHTPGTRRASRKNLSMFKKFLSINTPMCDCCFIQCMYRHDFHRCKDVGFAFISAVKLSSRWCTRLLTKECSKFMFALLVCLLLVYLFYHTDHSIIGKHFAD